MPSSDSPTGAGPSSADAGQALEPKSPVEQGASQEQREEAQIIAHASFSGPIPHPAMLRAYNEVETGLAMKLIKMSEEEARHRREIEKQESSVALQLAARSAEIQAEDMRRSYGEARIGQFCAVAIGLFAIGCGTYAGIHQAQITGCFVGAGGLGTIISAFILGRQQASKSNKDLEADETSNK